MAGDLKHIHDPVKAEEFARALGLQIGGAGHPFVGHWETKGLCAYSSGKYSGMAYFGTGGSERDRLTMPHESEKYRPWNRYDPDIPAHIRKKLIQLEDDDSTSIGQPHHSRRGNSEISDEEGIRLFKKTLEDHGVISDFLAGRQTSRGQPARTEPSRIQPARTETSTPTSFEGIVAGNVTITTSKSKYTIDEGIDFSFTASKLPDDAWIGIVPVAIPHGDEAVNDSHDTSYEHLRGRTNGEIILPNPGLGTWTLRLHDTDNNGRELTHVVFEVVSSLGSSGQRESATITTPMPSYVIVAQAGSSEVNGTYVFKPGEHDNRHWGTIAGHYQHTQNPEIFIAFQDCGAGHNRPDWNKWMIISKIGVLYAAHTGGKNGVPPRDGGWETVDSWGNPGAPGGKHPAPTVRHGDQDSDAATRIQEHTPSINIAEGKIALKSVHGKYLSAQPDGRAEWNRDIANEWEYFHLEKRQGGKITLRGAHGMYVSAQPGGEVQINRQAAPPTGWEEFTVEDRGNNVVCLKSIHGKYLSAQMDGTAQWNRDSAPKGGWEEFQVVYPGVPGGQTSDVATKIQEHATVGRQESIEILEAVTGKPVRFKINNRPSSNDAWVGIYPQNASDQDHGEHNKRWKWLRDIDVNNASFPKQAAGSLWSSIRVFSDGGHTLHERKDFTISAPIVKAEPLDPAVVKSTRKKAWTALAIGLLLLAPGIPLFIMGLGGGFQYEAVSSGTFEILDEDGQGDYGFEIFIEGEAGDFDGDGFHDYCENVAISANHTGGWFSTGPHGEIVAENPSDESREVFYLEIAHEGSEGCVSHHQPEQASHNGVQLVKIGRACKDCMNGTTTITAQNVEGGEILMWIRAEENQEKLGMLIPGAIMMGIGALTLIGSLGILAKTRHSHGRGQATSANSNPSKQGQFGGNDWFIELVKQSEAISLQLSQPDERSYHERSTERMKYPDKEKVEEDIRLGNSLQKWYAHWLHDAEKSSKIAESLGLGVGGAGSDFTGKWRTDGLHAYSSGKYNGYAYFGTGGSDESRLEPIGDDEKYRPWNRDDPNMPNDIREKLLMLEKVLARSYYLDPPK